MERMLLVSLLAALSLAFTGGANPRAGARPRQQQKSKLVRQIEGASPIPIYVEKEYEGESQVSIQEAKVKEISGDEFALLAGESAKHFKESTYPELILLNRSASRTIKSCALVVHSAAETSKAGHFLLKKNLSVLPNSMLTIQSSEWSMAERVSIQKGGQFISGLRQPGLDSAKSWLPGAASDLRVAVIFVEFTDGSNWIMPSSSH